jgi:flagellar P-ring protein precursor FlgI
MSGRFKLGVIIFLLICFTLPSSSMAVRIKDIATIQGVRHNQLFGYGLVIGLNGTGDKSGTGFTIQGLVNMLEKVGIHISADEVKVKNVAAVMINGTLPPFARIGQKIDVTVSSIGDAKSLSGGTLLMAPLTGVDGNVYALAQGPIAVGGFSSSGNAGGGVTKNHPTVARITGGAVVEKELGWTLTNRKELTVILTEPDFVTITRMARAIADEFGEGVAKPIDPGTLKLRVPADQQETIVDWIASISNLDITPDTIAKVIVNERTGTVVIGENVRISEVAVAHGNLSIEIKETQNVSQPAPFGTSRYGNSAPPQQVGGAVVAPGGATVVTNDSNVNVVEEDKRLMVIPEGKTVGELVRGLNAIGVTPRDLITILQSMKAAGALHAKLEII